MRINMVLAWCTLAALVFSVPAFVSIIHYCLHAGRQGKSFHKTRSMLCPYLLAAGFALLYFMREFYSPQTAYLLEMKQEEDADENDQGDAETLTKQLNRQLRRIRRGEPVDRLVLRL